jgi:pimeloyl-ACP methyl ester carboxylesterase
MKLLGNLLKWLGLLLTALVILSVGASAIHHGVRLAQEEADFPPPGQMVTVNGHRLHVYSEGSGEPTLVFLAGSGTSAPVLDFRALASRLAEEHTVAVVERGGYGWSEVTGSPRDLETMLAESRAALQLAGHAPPYVLFPHSMAGMEALYWASRYPTEVVAIVGLDPAVPQSYESFDMPPGLMIGTITFMARVGLIRLIPTLCTSSPAIAEGHLNQAEVATYCALFYRRTMTADMLAEGEEIYANAALVAAQGVPDLPMLFFISTGEGLAADWRSTLIAYADAAPNGRYHLLDVGHYVHNHAPDLISQESLRFLSSVLGD